jgi:alcohol dehydrogenase class IV
MGVFYIPTKIISGVGSVRGLGDEIDNLGARKPLIMTDAGIASAGIPEKVIGALKSQNRKCEVFDGIEPDPRIRNVVDAAQVIKKGGHDILIALGGGSSMDTAKGASILAVNELDLREHQGLRESYPNTPLPIIAIPTTAGTGSEVSRATIIIDEEKEFKMFLASPELRSKAVFLDADLLAGIPSSIAAATGVDALTHAMESYLSPNRTFVSEAASLEAIRLIFSNLRAFVANTNSLERAQNMLEASCLAGIGMSSGLGLIHGLAHPVGVKCEISHGLACALFLPHVLRFNWLVNPDQYRRMALVIDWSICSEFLSERDIALQVVAEVETLLEDIGIPRRLSDIGKSLPDVAGVIDEAYGSFLNLINPRPATKEEVEMLVKKVI